MLARASAHLEAFVAFILNDRRLLDALRDKAWATFARRYNGPGYAANDYDGKMTRNYTRLSGVRS